MNRRNRDIELLYEIGTMRHIDRTWRQFGGLPFANVCEHSFRVVWISLLIAKAEAADVAKVLKMALIHDLEETRCGDKNYVSRQYSTPNENNAVRDSLKNTGLEIELLEIWDEYCTKESLESKIVKDADNLDCDLEIREQRSRGALIAEVLMPTRDSVREKLFTSTARSLFDEISSSDPHQWHIRGTNRLTSGDWSGR